MVPILIKRLQFLLYFLLQSCLEEFKQQVFLSLVGGVVVQGEDDRIHKLGGLVLGHLEDQLGQVGWIGLKGEERSNIKCVCNCT